MIWPFGRAVHTWTPPQRARQQDRTLPLLLCAFGVIAGSLGLSGCAHAPSGNGSVAPRSFVFGEDNFSYANELLWEYDWDPAKSQHRRREPPPTYSHHCFVVARSARQFFQFAKFDPTQPTVSPAVYRQRIRSVVTRSPGHGRFETSGVTIPGYSNLFQFSAAQGELLRANCGGAWRSYFQRGHWRMILPFSKRHQERMSVRMMEELIHNRPTILHVVRFPELSINHALLAYDYREEDDRILYSVYDPYSPNAPQTLTFCRTCRAFYFPANAYFVGGVVDVYQIYHRWNY